MLHPLENQVDEKEFRKLLIHHFPELEKEIEDDAGLVHIEMAALENLANYYINNGNFEKLNQIHEFISSLAKHQKGAHPDLINAINVSFLDGLNYGNKKHGAQAKELLPKVLRQMWNAQMEHNRKIGWF